MGIGTVMEARTNLLLAFGANKARAIAEAAASALKRADYFRGVYDKKPDWQKV